MLLCCISFVLSAAIDHSIHTRETNVPEPENQSSTDLPAQEVLAEQRAVPYILQSGQGVPPPIPQPPGVNPAPPYGSKNI